MSAELPLESMAKGPGGAGPGGEVDGISVPFLALVGAVAGATPPLLLPTTTMVNVIGNGVIGAVVVTAMDVMLIRRTVEPGKLRLARILLIIAVSVTLALVTYKPAGFVFQTVFNTAPPAGVTDLRAHAYTDGAIGRQGLRLAFDATPTAVHAIRQSMSSLDRREGATFAEWDGASPWAEFVKAGMGEDSPLLEGAVTMKSPQGWVWTTPALGGRKVVTTMAFDPQSGLTLVEHRSR